MDLNLRQVATQRRRQTQRLHSKRESPDLPEGGGGRPTDRQTAADLRRLVDVPRLEPAGQPGAICLVLCLVVVLCLVLARGLDSPLARPRHAKAARPNAQL